MERLTFKVDKGAAGGRTLVVGRGDGPRRRGPAPPNASSRIVATMAAVRERYDWDYVWMLAFTFMLFFRPQDHIPALEPLHLAEMTAIAGLAAMAVRRMNAGQTV